MRTKTLILGFAISAVSLATSLADTNVYSANIVGYVNYANPAGYRIIANPLNSTNNDVANLFASPPENLTVFKRKAGGGYDQASYSADNIGAGGVGDVTGWDALLSLQPGEAAFLLNPLSGNYTNTFVGEVKTSSTNSVPNGYSLIASVVPQSGGLVSVLGFPGGTSDMTAFFFNGAGYNQYNYSLDNGGNNWSDGGIHGDGSAGAEPVPAVGQGFWILNTGASTNWVRNFTVN